MRKWLPKLLILLLISILIALPILFTRFVKLQSPTNIPGEFYKTHILGGFSIDTPAKVSKAAHDGVQVVFKYDQPPTESDQLGQKLQSLRMKVIDGYISSLLYYYECHRTKILR